MAPRALPGRRPDKRGMSVLTCTCLCIPGSWSPVLHFTHYHIYLKHLAMMAYTVNDVYCHLDLVCCTGLYRRLLEQVHSTLIPLYPGASGPGTARSVRERMFTATYMYIISTWMTMIVERKACVCSCTSCICI